jgi:CelD/BcsL family acetyltransferase involved in cellulose biosynthesis
MSEAAVAEPARRAPILSARNRLALRSSLEAEVIEGASAYETLRADWHRIADTQSGALLFQTPELLSAWARHFPTRRLATVVVRDGSRPVMIWPLAIERQATFKIARGAGAPIGQYEDILLDRDADGAAALRSALDALGEAIRPDLVLLERVRADSALRAVLQDISPICWVEAAPFADLSGGLDRALSAVKPAVSKKQRKRMRRFYREGRARFALADHPDEAEAWIADALALKREWLRSTGRISRAFIKAASGNCLGELARTLWNASTGPRMVVARLTLDGRTAAYEAGFHYRDSFHLYLRAFAPDLAVLGPGNVLTEHMLGWCAENGISRYDMLAPRSRNKREWQSGEVAVLDFALPLTLAGRLYRRTAIRTLAPVLRDAFYALPAPLRSALASRALKM